MNEFALFNSSVDLVGLMPLLLSFVFLSFCSGCFWFLDDGDDGSWIMVTMIMKMIYLVHIIVNISPMVAFFQQTLPQLLRRNSFEERWTLVKILDRVWLCDDHEVEDDDDKYLHDRLQCSRKQNCTWIASWATGSLSKSEIEFCRLQRLENMVVLWRLSQSSMMMMILSFTKGLDFNSLFTGGEEKRHFRQVWKILDHSCWTIGRKMKKQGYWTNLWQSE